MSYCLSLNISNYICINVHLNAVLKMHMINTMQSCIRIQCKQLFLIILICWQILKVNICMRFMFPFVYTTFASFGFNPDFHCNEELIIS